MRDFRKRNNDDSKFWDPRKGAIKSEGASSGVRMISLFQGVL